MFENWNYDAVIKNVEEALKIMGLGMLGIFVVIGLIAVMVLILSKVTGKDAKNDTE